MRIYDKYTLYTYNNISVYCVCIYIYIERIVLCLEGFSRGMVNIAILM